LKNINNNLDEKANEPLV